MKVVCKGVYIIRTFKRDAKESSRFIDSDSYPQALIGQHMLIHAFVVPRKFASRENLSSGFPIRSDTNRARRPQKMVRGLKLRL